MTDRASEHAAKQALRRETMTADANSSPSGATRAIAFRGGGFAPVIYPSLGYLTLAAILALWQTAASAGWVSPTFLPGPLAIAGALKDLAISGQLWDDVSASMSRIAAGWISGTLAGLATGVLMGLFSVARSVWKPAVSALYPIPKIALLPLIILWLGIGETSKVVTIAAGVFFPTVIATYSSIDGVPRNLIRMSQSFSVPLSAIILKTLLPGAMPGILAGMRISVATGLLTVVAAEMIGAQNGVGAFVLLQGSLMRSDMLLAGVVTIGVLGLGIGAVISMIENRLFKWR